MVMGTYKFKFDNNPKNNHLKLEIEFQEAGMEDGFDEFFILKNNPKSIPISATRNGKYEVRKRGIRVLYYHYNGMWVQFKTLQKYDGILNLINWNLLPALTNTEIENMNKIPINRYTKRWRNILYAYNFLIESDERKRKFALYIIKYKKQNEILL
jgi:hypothetical protein